MSIAGARETLAAFRQLPKDASKELRDASTRISEVEAVKIRSAAASSSAQSALVAPGIRARRDRLPSIVVGGARKVGRNRKPLNKIMYGANFGATALKQFRPHRGAGDEDYWFFSTVEKDLPQMVDQWGRAVDKVIRRWGNG
ncbi:hypothetical protein [Kribbella hippodromi]|uniref:hypothetical protein n=1 Tax=Kribbella hippodromi TaxID=434347 RepID=UPI0031DF7018